MKKNLNILLVEDESLLALEFASCITECGYNVVDYVTTSKEAINAIKNSDVNLIIMDINLNEKMTGIELYKQLKTDALIIYLTAYKDEKTISDAIKTEPLGYLVKPLNEKELHALLKLAEIKVAKKAVAKKQLIELSNDYSFDMQNEKLYHKGVFIKLSSKKLQLLKLLLEAKGDAVSFKTIEEELWKESPPSESTLRTLIYRLRNDLEYDMIENELNYGVKLKDSSPDTCGT